MSSTDEKGLATSLEYQNGGRRIVASLPSSATDIRENYLDRRISTRTGSAVVEESHDYYLGNEESGPYMWHVKIQEKVNYGGSSLRWKKFGTGWFGTQNRIESPDYDGTNSVIQKTEHWDCLSNPSFTFQSGKGETYYDMDFDNTIGRVGTGPEQGVYLNSKDRIQRTLKQFVKQGNAWLQTETNLTYLVDDDLTPTVTSISSTRLSGFSSSNVISEVTTWDADTNATVVTTYVDLPSKKLTDVTDAAFSTLNATNIAINGLLQAESTFTVATPLRRYYDALGREISVLSPLGFSASKSYNQYGQVTNMTDFTGNRTTYEFYPNGAQGAGQLKRETRSNGRKTSYGYTARGELWRTWGDVPYPEERIYSVFGELTELRTFRGGTGWTASTWPTGNSYDSTTWIYQEHSGLLTNKTDAAGRSVSFAYTNGMLWTRAWARGITTTNAYNDFGDLLTLEYSDGTRSVSFTNYSRAGMPRKLIDATGTNSLSYDHAGRLVLTTNIDGLLVGVAVSSRFNGLYGRDRLQVLGPSPPITNDYRYDATSGRLSVVSNGVHSTTYGYLVNSDLLQTTTCKSNTTAVLTTTCSWEYGMRLGAIVNEVNGVNISSRSYTYDDLNRRTRAALEDGSYWQYNYNDRNELIGARHFWWDMSAVSGQQFGYEYDNIGNRKTTSSGGDTNGANLRTTSYTTNNLNQYTAITTPGYEDILGATWATNGVMINSNPADRKGEYFHCEITVGNGSSPVWQGVTVISGGASSNGGFVFPKNS